MLKFDYKNTGVTEELMAASKEKVEAAYNTLVNKTGAGNDFLGWVDLPKNYDKQEFARIKAAAEKIDTNIWELSDRERQIVKSLGK